MSYIVDIIIIAVFIITVIISYKKGFFRSLFDLIGTMVAVLFARIFSDSFAPQGYEMFIKEPARATLEKSLGTVGTTDYAAQAQEAINSIPDSMSGVMSFMGIDKQVLLERVSSSALAEGTLIDNIMANVVAPVGTAIIQFVLFVVLAIVFIIGLKLVVRLLDFIIKRLPAVKQLNKGLGVVIGAVRGVIVAVIIAMLISLVSGFVGNEAFLQAVENSTIVSAVQSIFSSVSTAVIN